LQLCCKKEVPKIEALLARIVTKNDLKIEVAPKAKQVTVWHGSDTTSWLGPMFALLNSGAFLCDVVSVKGQEVVSCSLVTNASGELVENALLVVQEGPTVRVFYPGVCEAQVRGVLKSLFCFVSTVC
jgi:hypothetical protein